MSADWPQITEAVTRSRAATHANGLTSQHDQVAAKVRGLLDKLGVNIADPDELYVVLVAWRLMAAFQEQATDSPFRVSAHLFGALASLVPERVLT